MKKFILLLAISASTSLLAQDKTNDWLIACSKDKFTDAISCTTSKNFPEWQGAKPYIPIKATITKLGNYVSFGFHDHPQEFAKIRIDSNTAFIQKTNLISGDRADSLINQMKSGRSGSISTRVWRDLTFDLDFSLTGFSEAFDSLKTAFQNYE